MYNTLTITNAPWAYLIDMSIDTRNSIRGLPGKPDTFGHVDDDGNYYIGIAEGKRDGQIVACRDIRYGAFYAERLFCWGMDDNNNDLPFERVRAHLAEIGYKPQPMYWDKCNVWRGYKDGKPTFHSALRADTHYGGSWYDIQRRIDRGLPDHWSYDFIPGGMETATIYIELPDE